MPARSPAPGTFEIALVMAGAVSAGAYTAGVLDYLFEALDAWDERKRAGDRTIPDHAVQIRAISGTSAGGIGSALSAMMPFLGGRPVNDLQATGYSGNPLNAKTNILYRAWVEDIDIRKLLTLSDLKSPSKVVRSILNSDAIDQIADLAVADVRGALSSPLRKPPGYFANPLQLFLSLANLRGVPYLITMRTEGGGVRGHRMVAHMDYAHFAVFGTNQGTHEALPNGATAVNWKNAIGKTDGWQALMNASISTSAFPVGLRARPFENDISVYQSKLWPRAFGDAPNTASPLIAPDLNPADARPYEFWTCDGGVLNNEPLEYARVALSGAPDERNPRDAKQADRAVIMIDPFPDDSGMMTPLQDDLTNLMRLPFAVLSALKSQARFKPNELSLALREDIFSRFLIAPRRGDKKEPESEIASSGLDGFAGFLNRDFRRHDFQLGRMNCQKFLRDHLAVHVDNPIVAPSVARLRASGNLSAYHTKTRDASSGIERPDEQFIQLIPVVPNVASRVQPLPWPRRPEGAQAFADALSPDIKRRLEAVVDRIVPSLMEAMGADKGLFSGLIAWLAERKLRAKLQDLSSNAIVKDLKGRGLG